MSSLRIKVQLGNESSDAYSKTPNLFIKFVYVIDLPTDKTINELIHLLKAHIKQQFINDNIEIVQLKTHDGFILSKFDICSNVLKDNDHIICIDMNGFLQEYSSTINDENQWLRIEEHDASDNQEKYISVGLSTFQKLFIEMRGSLITPNLYLFTFHELMTIANEKRKDNLISRLDSTDNEEENSSDWFVETKWEYDTKSDKDLFLICNLKVGSNDEILSQKLHIKLDQSRKHIRKGEITHLSGEGNNGQNLTKNELQRLAELATQIPPAKHSGPKLSLNTEESLRIKKYECEGDSSIRMTNGNTNTVNVYQESQHRNNEMVQLNFIITHIIFSKKTIILPEILQHKRSTPAEKPVSVTTLTVFYQTHDGAWHECQEVAIASVVIRDEKPKWLTDPVINIEPDKLISFAIKGAISVKGKMAQDHQARQRMHKNLPQPCKLKIVITDNFGKQCSLIVEQLNKPIEVTTKESYMKSNESSIKQFLAFAYADDCDLDERIYMIVYLNNENSLTIRNPTGSSISYGNKYVRTLEYNAKQNKTTESRIEYVGYKHDTHEYQAIALFDPQTYLFYAVRLELSTKTSKTEETVFIPRDKIQ